MTPNTELDINPDGWLRDVATDVYDHFMAGEEWDRREVNRAIAHEANEALADEIEHLGYKVTTTQHNERVILAHENERRPPELGYWQIRVDEEALNRDQYEREEFIADMELVIEGWARRVAEDARDRVFNFERPAPSSGSSTKT